MKKKIRKLNTISRINRKFPYDYSVLVLFIELNIVIKNSIIIVNKYCTFNC